MARKKWSEQEIQFVKDNYMNMTCKRMGLELGRTERAVEHLSAKLELVREPSVGDKFGRLEIKEKFFDEESRKTYAICTCKCGKETRNRLTDLVQERIVSCGCWKAEKAGERTTARNFKHGYGSNSHRLFRIWSAMKTRCFNPNIKEYHNYGGRGITICEEWLHDFIKFKDWALSHGYSYDLSIDRIDNNGNYEPSNCRWATAKQQTQNRRNNRQDTVKITAWGETKAVLNWLEDDRCTIKSVATICYRIGAGWTPEEAISKSSERRVKNEK